MNVAVYDTYGNGGWGTVGGNERLLHRWSPACTR